MKSHHAAADNQVTDIMQATDIMIVDQPQELFEVVRQLSRIHN
jgi:hypothetical protein